MPTIEQMLEEWHSAADGLPPSMPLALYDKQLAELRKSLKDEENDEVSAEFAPAIESFDPIDLAKLGKELADEVYVAFGTARQYGIPLEACVAEVHRSNMTKMIGGKQTNGKGKVLKGPAYEEADIGTVLLLHRKLDRLVELNGGINNG